MTISKGLDGKDSANYASFEELDQASGYFLSGQWDKLHPLQIEEFQRAQADPFGLELEAEEAGMLDFGVKKEVVDLILHHYLRCEDLEEGWTWLRQEIGPHRIDFDRLYAVFCRNFPQLRHSKDLRAQDAYSWYCAFRDIYRAQLRTKSAD